MRTQIASDEICHQPKLPSDVRSHEHTYILMLLSDVQQFLDIWFQHIDAWLQLYSSMPDIEDKVVLIEATREMVQGFLDALETIETDPLNNLPPIEEKDET